jgi:hypothetical protein
MSLMSSDLFSRPSKAIELGSCKMPPSSTHFSKSCSTCSLGGVVAVARMQSLPTCKRVMSTRGNGRRSCTQVTHPCPHRRKSCSAPFSVLLTFQKPTQQLSVEVGADVIRTMFVAWTKLARWSGRTACWLKVVNVRHAFSFCTVFLA